MVVFDGGIGETELTQSQLEGLAEPLVTSWLSGWARTPETTKESTLTMPSPPTIQPGLQLEYGRFRSICLSDRGLDVPHPDDVHDICDHPYSAFLRWNPAYPTEKFFYFARESSHQYSYYFVKRGAGAPEYVWTAGNPIPAGAVELAVDFFRSKGVKPWPLSPKRTRRLVLGT